MKFFHVPTFIISLAIGLFLTYITKPDPYYNIRISKSKQFR